ncbi:MAG: hypothetical protein AB1649_13980 [Chloroflexota bacterium]
MKLKIFQGLAIVLVLLTGYLHFVTIPEEYAEAPYMGWLFFANALGSLVAAIGILRRKTWSGWVLGLVIVGGSILGYIQSRTLGMPGMEIEPWPNVSGIAAEISGKKDLAASLDFICGVTPLDAGTDFASLGGIGLSAMLVETLFLAVFVLARPMLAIDMNRDFSAFNNSVKSFAASRYFYPALMLSVLLVAFGSYRLGSLSSGKHSEHPLPETILTAQDLEDEYGIRLTLVGLTAAGGLVDVRYYVIDPVKAAKLAGEDGIMPLVHVEGSDVVLMPDHHMRTQKLIADRMYFSLIPNAGNVVKRGTSVIVVFGDVAVEPVITQ